MQKVRFFFVVYGKCCTFAPEFNNRLVHLEKWQSGRMRRS